MTNSQRAIERIREIRGARKLSVDAAARVFATENPTVAQRVLEDIGSWPSSEPELAALQREAVWER